MQLARRPAEEREEYEPHVAAGNVVFAGVDYAAIVESADAEAIVRARYDYAETGDQPLGSLTDAFLSRICNSVAKGAAE